MMNTILSQSNHSLDKRKSAAFVTGMNQPLPFFYPCTLNIKVLLNKTSTIGPTSLTKPRLTFPGLAGYSNYLKFKMNFWTMRIEHTETL